MVLTKAGEALGLCIALRLGAAWANIAPYRKQERMGAGSHPRRVVRYR